MKTTGVSGIPTFGLLDFLGHPNTQFLMLCIYVCFSPQELLLEAVNFLVPNKYSNFTVDFEKVLSFIYATRDGWEDDFCIALSKMLVGNRIRGISLAIISLWQFFYRTQVIIAWPSHSLTDALIDATLLGKTPFEKQVFEGKKIMHGWDWGVGSYDIVYLYQKRV